MFLCLLAVLCPAPSLCSPLLTPEFSSLLQTISTATGGGATSVGGIGTGAGAGAGAAGAGAAGAGTGLGMVCGYNFSELFSSSSSDLWRY